MDIHELESKIHSMVDDLQGLCSTVGLSNTANEEVVVTSVFLYKFLNDKFMYNLGKFSEEIDVPVESILKNEDDMLDAFYEYNSKDVAFSYEDTIQYLINHIEQQDFYKQFDDALVRISKNVKNEAFAVETADGEKTDLFEPLTVMVESAQRNNFAKAIFGIIAKDKFDFSEAFGGSFDFYSAIFEYLIKNYNVASGTYAEYFTPQTVSSIIAKILVGMSDTIEAAEIYDPAAGSGSLILHLAHELGQEGGMNRAIVYTQDISKKSTRFLRLNMMLNGKSESLGNIIRGDTLESPAHFNVEHEPDSGVKKFDYITTNPPFKTDFSATRDRIEQKWQDTSRFFAGVPKIPNAKKESMAIYLLFIQHVLYSLKEDGKAAIVVPTGFLTAKSGIEFAIREKMVKGHMLKGVISMPSNIFANTGTNVSVIFLDKANTAEDVILIDASKLGEKVKEGKNQKTVLRDFEVRRIIDTFIQRNVEDDFSVIVGYDKLEEKGYSFSAGQYFEVRIDYRDISGNEFIAKMGDYSYELQKIKESVLALLYQTKIKTIFDYWFVQFDFPDENGKPYKTSGGKMVWNEELKREIPDGWTVSTFGDCISSINTGLNPRDNFKLNTGGTIRYLTVKNLTKDGTVDFSSCDCIDEAARAIVHRRSDIRVGDILFASIAPLGRCYIIKESPETWDINESVFSIRPNYSNMTSNYLYMTFMSDSFVKKAEGSSAGSVFKGIRISELQALKTVVPQKEVLEKFDEIISKVFAAKVDSIENDLSLASLRDDLLPFLTNGQVKVGGKE